MASSLSSSLDPQGFHFSVSTTVRLGAHTDRSVCSLHILHDLPPHVYADQYELAQRPGYNSSLWGTADLERPVSAVDPRGSVLLLSVDGLHLSQLQHETATLDVPLHARYGRPTERQDAPLHTVTLRRPLGFFACAADNVAPMPSVLEPYQSLDGWPTSPLTLIPDSAPLEQLQVSVPVGLLDDLPWVDVGTALVMIVMFFYLLIASIRTARRLSTKPSGKTD